MIRGALRLALVGAGIGYAIDRILAKQAEGADPEPISSMIVIDAPIERVWAEVADIEGQPRWMLEMKAVRLLTPGPVGVGTEGEADVRILGIQVSGPGHGSPSSSRRTASGSATTARSAVSGLITLEVGRRRQHDDRPLGRAS